MTKRLTTEEFIAKAKAVHGDRYDYSLSEYKTGHIKLKIQCKEHGVFEQSPANHLQGAGCILCGFKNAGQYHKKDTEKFIIEAKAIHGERYNYSQTQYKGSREKLTIICPKHGAFEQTAHVHLRGELGAGCERCSYEKRAENARMGFDEFVNTANSVHGNFYDYSKAKSEFTDTTSPMEITCPLHGGFKQTPSNHMRGQGCPVCGAKRGADILRKSTEDFIKEAKVIHKDIYDYSLTDYQGAFNDIKIICSIDGIFNQTPTSHLAGTGCPKCSRRNQGAPRNLTRALRGEFDDEKKSFVYVIRFKLPHSDIQLYKVGSGTGKRLKSVIKDIQKVNGSDISCEEYPLNSTGESIVFEFLAHDQIQDYRFAVPQEYKFAGYSEVFTKEPDLTLVDKEFVLNEFRLGKRQPK